MLAPQMPSEGDLLLSSQLVPCLWLEEEASQGTGVRGCPRENLACTWTRSPTHESAQDVLSECFYLGACILRRVLSCVVSRLLKDLGKSLFWKKRDFEACRRLFSRGYRSVMRTDSL